MAYLLGLAWTTYPYWPEFQDLPSLPTYLDLPRLAYPYWPGFQDLPSWPGCLDLPRLAYLILAWIPGFAFVAWLPRLA